MTEPKTVRLVNDAGTVVRVSADQVEILGRGFRPADEPRKPGRPKKSE